MLVLGSAPAASAAIHTGESNCVGTLSQRGAEFQGACSLPFQGFPIGVAGVYDSDPEDLAVPPGSKPAEIHVELKVKVAGTPPRPLGVECRQLTTGIARCEADYNPLSMPLTSPEPAPLEAAEIICEAHSHAAFSQDKLPAGKFACWSTDEARAGLEEDGFFADNGFPSQPPPDPEPDPGVLGPLAGAGANGVVTTVPFNTYLPNTLVVSRSLGLKYVNADTATHDVVAFNARRLDGSAAWCKDFDSGKCPLFWSPLIPGGGSETPVLGLEDAVVGESYSFFCSIHPYMVGTIEVVE